MRVRFWFSTLVMDSDLLNKEKSIFNLFLFFYFVFRPFLTFCYKCCFLILHLTLFTSQKIKNRKKENGITFYISTLSCFVWRSFFIYIFCYREYFGIRRPIFSCTVVFISLKISEVCIYCKHESLFHQYISPLFHYHLSSKPFLLQFPIVEF